MVIFHEMTARLMTTPAAKALHECNVSMVNRLSAAHAEKAREKIDPHEVTAGASPTDLVRRAVSGRFN